MKAAVYITRRFARYEEECVFEKDKFVEISEDYFNHTVIKYRDQFDFNYINGGQEFIDKNTGLRVRRFYDRNVLKV